MLSVAPEMKIPACGYFIFKPFVAFIITRHLGLTAPRPGVYCLDGMRCVLGGFPSAFVQMSNSITTFIRLFFFLANINAQI